jgi:transcriptional regulator with XRE-family HTH domain
MTNNYYKFIKGLRIQKGLSQAEIAQKIGISRSSYIGFEQGKTELTLSAVSKLAEFFGVTLQEIETGEVPNYEKYKQMILAFLRLSGKTTKTKLAKLLYFADFGWFYYHLKSMSGMQYRKMSYGPVSDAYFRIIDDMSEHGEININSTEDGAMLISETRSGTKVGLSSLNKEEEKLIKDIEKKWKNKKTSEIVDFTHKQFPYLYSKDNEIVSYALFTQENPDEIF